MAGFWRGDFLWPLPGYKTQTYCFYMVHKCKLKVKVYGYTHQGALAVLFCGTERSLVRCENKAM